MPPASGGPCPDYGLPQVRYSNFSNPFSPPTSVEAVDLFKPTNPNLTIANTGEEKVKARSYAFATAFLSVATTMLMLKVSDVQSSYSSALSEKQTAEFYSAVWSFVGVVCIAAPLFAINEYVDNRLAIEWRLYLTRRLLKAYFSNQAYFRLKMDAGGIDNPDQRICDDVRAFASTSVVLAIGVLRQAFYCVAFAGEKTNCCINLDWTSSALIHFRA